MLFRSDYIEELVSSAGIETDPKKVGIGIGVLLEMRQYPGVEKPIAVLTRLWAG